ncbi:MAG TPA: hypothetical protein DCL54_18360 [Alphaproteobacteria bacterium]|nr:hypothetical protein [Alphaproteobacteria bacterium]HAJ48545.1 hypothetical protein [Alphaproteobacteria bacterium]
MSIKRILLAGLTVTSAAAAWPARAETVGEATRVRLVAYQTPPAANRETVYRLSPILRNAKLETVAEAAMEVTFVDGSTLTLGPSSESVVDEFVYTGPGSTSQQAIKLTKGVFRFISGAVQKDKVKLQTPTATVGIRGTIVRAKVQPGSDTTIFFEQGSGEVCGANAKCAAMAQGDMVKIDSRGNLSAPEQKSWSTGDEATDLGMGVFGRQFRGPDAGGGGNDGGSDPGGGSGNNR